MSIIDLKIMYKIVKQESVFLHRKSGLCVNL